MVFFRQAAALAGIASFFLAAPALCQPSPAFVRGFLPTGPVLEGANTISHPEVMRLPDGRWRIKFDYFYTGDPEDAALYVEQLAGRGGQNDPGVALVGTPVMPQKGQHQLTLDVPRPEGNDLRVTREVRVQLRKIHPNNVLVGASIATSIAWPDDFSMQVDRDIATVGVAGVVGKAVAWIDVGTDRSLKQARSLLEKVIERDPRADAAYVEMARIAMKTNWGPQGLRQAENLIQSALQIQPENLNATILLGYVYAHQKRFTESERLFNAVAAQQTKNLWLWVNWGELLDLQGKIAEADQKYREAVARPPTGDTYDRARLDAYARLLAHLERGEDLDGMEALHKKRSQEYNGRFCSGVNYARFLVMERGEAATAINLLRDSSPALCDASVTREALGLAFYAAWAAGTGSDAESMLNRARVYLPSGPQLFYQLASSKRTLATARRLIATGEQVDQIDNLRMNALAYSLWSKDHGAAQRLLQLGARSDAMVGADGMPVALIPVLTQDVAGARLLVRSGVNYGEVQFQGSTGVDLAKRSGNRELLEAVAPRASTL